MSHYTISQAWRKDFWSKNYSQKMLQSTNSAHHSMIVSIDIPSPTLQIEGHMEADKGMQMCVLDQKHFGKKPNPWLPKLL